MEALLILFAPLIQICLAPVIALLGAVLSVVVELAALIFAILYELVTGKKRARGEANPRKPLIPRKWLHWSAGGLLALGVLGIVASFLFFDPILRWGLARAEAKTGVEIRYERSAGNLLAGKVALDGITMRRAAETGLTFDIVAERVAVDVALASLLWGEAEIRRAEVTGIRGYVTPPEGDKDKPKRKKKPRDFTVDDIRIDDVALDVRPRGREAYPFVIEAANVAPFDSRMALFSLLFRSNMRAEIAGQDLSVETREITEFGRETFWRFEDIEADRLKLLVPKAPLTWLEGGRVNVRVDDRWSLEEDWIEMDWHLVFESVEVAVPEGAGLREKALAKGFSEIVAAKGGDAEFHYKLNLDQKEIAVAKSGDLSGFGDIVAGQLIGRADTEEAKDAAEAADGKVKGALERMKGLLRRDGE